MFHASVSGSFWVLSHYFPSFRKWNFSFNWTITTIFFSRHHTHTPFLTETVVQLKYRQCWKNSVIRVKVLRVTNFLLLSLLVQSINTETKSDEVLIPLSFPFYCKLKNVFFWRLFFLVNSCYLFFFLITFLCYLFFYNEKKPTIGTNNKDFTIEGIYKKCLLY